MFTDANIVYMVLNLNKSMKENKSRIIIKLNLN